MWVDGWFGVLIRACCPYLKEANRHHIGRTVHICYTPGSPTPKEASKHIPIYRDIRRLAGGTVILDVEVRPTNRIDRTNDGNRPNDMQSYRHLRVLVMRETIFDGMS